GFLRNTGARGRLGAERVRSPKGLGALPVARHPLPRLLGRRWRTRRRRTRRCSRRRGHVGLLEFKAHPAPAAAELCRSGTGGGPLMQTLVELLTVLPPPRRPFHNQGDWAVVEAAIGLRLPSDYKAFVAAYGRGTINNCLVIESPFGTKEDLRK